MNKKSLSETDIRTKFITPAIQEAGWDIQTQIREEFTIAPGRIMVRGKLHSRGPNKWADYVLCYHPNKPIAVLEAKDNKHNLGDGMQQAQDYADRLDVPFAISSNGDGFLFHDQNLLLFSQIETELALTELPGPETLWAAYCQWKQLPPHLPAVEQPYYDDGQGRKPRYYQMVAINRTVEAIAKGQQRVLLVMATGTGKTYTAFQIIWRLWKSKQKQRILFLADRNALVDQTMVGDFKPFGQAMAKLSPKSGGIERNGKKLDQTLAIKKGKDHINKVNTAYEIYLGLYQAISGSEETRDIYKQFSPEFFDLIIVDECHRGSASEDSAWHEILDYFSSATHIGLTATPKETTDISNSHYFGEPIYTYSLKQGINDGYLAPYKVIRIDFDKDLQGWRPHEGQKDAKGQLIEDRIYNQRDFDKTLTMTQRTELVAKTVTEYLQQTDPMQKTIVFCDTIEHAERMRKALVNANTTQIQKNPKYVMRITGDESLGKAELDHFIDPEESYPVIAVTSKLMTTGIDAQTCKLIVLDQRIQSMTEFKQIIGRGTRINEEYNKYWFSILDFKKATELFADPAFDGSPEVVYEPTPEGPLLPPDEPDIPDSPDDVPTPIIHEPVPDYPTDGDMRGDDGGDMPEPPKRYVVNDVPFKVIDKRVQYLNANGKLISESLTDYTRKTVQKRFATLNDFLKRWNGAERKQAIIDELAEQGVFWDELKADVSKKLGGDTDPFDIITHIVYGQPALTRKQRAAKARGHNYFTKYQGAARKVLDTLLDKYADTDIATIEDTKVLQLSPFTELGTAIELIGAFGSKAEYEQAVKALEDTLYNEEAG